MKFKNSIFLIILLVAAIGQDAYTQCKTWVGSPNEDELTNDHSVYRSLVKNENYKDAFAPWKRVYDAAPAADGNRDFHYTDGIKIYRNMYDNATSDADKQTYVNEILKLYDEVIACYEARAIALRCDDDSCYDEKISDLYSRKAYDMYYHFRTPYSQTSKALQSALDKGGMAAPYTVVTPYADIAVYEFTNKKIDKVEARRIHDELLALCETNQSNGHPYAQYYGQAKDAMLGKFREIEDYIFDCAYFQEQWMPEYEANSEDPLFARDLYNRLRQKGCDETNPFLAKLAKQYESYAAEENARREAEFRANNPAFVAKEMYDLGDNIGAIQKYREAISIEPDPEKKANYHLAVASILFRRLDKLGDARSEALDAARTNPGWGRPYALIGDIYAKAARGCGDSWNQRLAVLAAYDKWGYAKSLETDNEQIADLESKMSRYRSSFPTKDEGFMRGMRAGTSTTVGCWIGETVRIRYQ